MTLHFATRASNPPLVATPPALDLALSNKPTENDAASHAAEHSFEESLKELGEIVQQLEDGGLGLAESLARYEQGVKHLRDCYRALKQAERKIELLAGVDAQGNAQTEPFEEPEDGEFEQQAATRSRQRTAKKRASPRKPPPPDDVGAPPSLF
jgi:exodeoxyribonuclease VII small subunit